MRRRRESPPAAPVIEAARIGAAASTRSRTNAVSIRSTFRRDRVDFDLKTDSWAQLDAGHRERQMRHLHAQLQQPVDLREALQAVFPFAHFVLTDVGADSRARLLQAWPKKGLVPQNLLFPSGIFHQIDKGFSPCELPHPAVFELESDEAYKGDLAWDGAAGIRREPRRPTSPIVCIEVSDNAAGGSRCRWSTCGR